MIFLSIESNHNTYTRVHSKFIFHSLLNYERNPINHYCRCYCSSMTYAHLFCFSNNNLSNRDSPSKKISLTKCQKVCHFVRTNSNVLLPLRLWGQNKNAQSNKTRRHMLEVIGKSIINRRLILTRHYKMQWQKERCD